MTLKKTKNHFIGEFGALSVFGDPCPACGKTAQIAGHAGVSLHDSHGAMENVGSRCVDPTYSPTSSRIE